MIRAKRSPAAAAVVAAGTETEPGKCDTAPHALLFEFDHGCSDFAGGHLGLARLDAFADVGWRGKREMEPVTRVSERFAMME